MRGVRYFSNRGLFRIPPAQNGFRGEKEQHDQGGGPNQEDQAFKHDKAVLGHERIKSVESLCPEFNPFANGQKALDSYRSSVRRSWMKIKRWLHFCGWGANNLI